jgi:hypothetical protein
MAEADTDSTGAARPGMKSARSALMVSHGLILSPAAPALSQGFGGDTVDDIIIRSLPRVVLSSRVELSLV